MNILHGAANDDINIKASAYNALAQSGSPLAYPVLVKCSKGMFHTDGNKPVPQLLFLIMQRVVGQNGDIKTMDKICKLIISKCNDNLTIQNKTEALDTICQYFMVLNAMANCIQSCCTSE